MATEDDLRAAQIDSLQEHLRLAQAQAWTPSTVDVARMVIDRINDKYSGTTAPNIAACTAEVVAVLKAVHTALQAADLWGQPRTPER